MIRVLANIVCRAIFHPVRTEGLDPAALEGPSLLVSSHFGGFADPILLLSAVPRTPRFLAKSTLWDAFWLKPFLDLVHAIPIYRAEDGATTSNTATFAAATEALRTGQTVAIFPEGFANDAPGLAPLKTGVARLALEAAASGVGLTIVPVCTQYEDKTRMGTGAWLQQGEPLRLHDTITNLGITTPSADDREQVGLLTDLISDRLRAIGPVFSDEAEANLLILAGQVASDRHPERSFVPARRIACELARLGAEQSTRVRGVADVYATWLDGHGLAEPDVARSQRGRPTGDALLGLAGAVLLAPFALAGLAMNAVPWLIVIGGRALRDAPVKEVTINVFVAAPVFALTWLAWLLAGWTTRSLWFGFVLLVAAPLLGVAALVWREGVRRIVRASRVVRTRRILGSLGGEAGLVAREHVRAAVASALAPD